MLSLLQLDAKLIEGEPNNRLIRKIKDNWEVTRQFQILDKSGTPVPKSAKNQCRPCGAQSSVVDAQFCFAPTHPVGQKI